MESELAEEMSPEHAHRADVTTGEDGVRVVA